MHSPLDLPAKYASKGGFARQTAARSFALLVLLHHVAQVFGREIGPPFRKKAKLGEGAFPEQKIGEALFAAGADQQIDIRGAAALDFGEDAAERFAREVRDFVELAGGLEDCVAGGI